MPDDLDQWRRELHEAAADQASEVAARAALEALARGFKSLEKGMQIGHTWNDVQTHVQADSSAVSDVPDGLFEVLAPLNGTAASLVSGAIDLIASHNYYAAAALNRQLVEVEYLTWAFENDLAHVVDWYHSDRKEREKRWGPQALRDLSEGKFPNEDYWQHCEVGGHPTPVGMRALLHSDEVVSAALARYEVISHGYHAWLYAVASVEAMCERYGVDPVLVLPEDGQNVTASKDRWAQVEKLTETGARVKPE